MTTARAFNSREATYSSVETATRLRALASRFVDLLTPSQRARASFRFDDAERFVWHYTPVKRRGVPLKEMGPAQRDAARRLLACGLSQEGARTAEAIMALETVLDRIEKEEGDQRFRRDPELYYFSVFGHPWETEPWGWRVDGHHLSLHYTVVDGDMLAVTPSFFGANPARVPSGPEKGLRVLAPLEDLARELAGSLDRRQLAKTLIEEDAPRDILTTNLPRVTLEKTEGLPASALSSAQRKGLVSLVGAYVGRMPAEVASREMGRLESRGIDALHFAWAGSLEPGKPHYYRIHGPGFLIEYDNVQNEANHIHSVWRDLENDFGEDMLRLHHRHDHAQPRGASPEAAG